MERLEQLLSRNVEKVIEKEHLRKALASGKKLRVKLGIDPTSPDLHLGHAVVLNKLREFQELGNTAVLIIGDFTAQIGDPSGRDKTRPPLTAIQVKENMKHYLSQAGKIIDIKKAEIRYNSEWLGKMRAPEILHLLSLVSLQQVIEREDFKKRLNEHLSIRASELLYPILQGYDSVAVQADVELGGNDQLFNVLMGRVLLEAYEMKPQDILTVPLLVGLDGERKMSKSLGNYIGLTDTPEDMFGKVMSLPDGLMGKYFMLCTDMSADDVAKLTKTLKPKALKEALGVAIVKLYHGEVKAKAAQANFEKVFAKQEVPEDISEIKLKKGDISALDLLMATNAVKSKSEGRRLIEQGGFEVNEESSKDVQKVFKLRGGEVIKVGKRRFFKVKI